MERIQLSTLDKIRDLRHDQSIFDLEVFTEIREKQVIRFSTRVHRVPLYSWKESEQYFTTGVAQPQAENYLACPSFVSHQAIAIDLKETDFIAPGQFFSTHDKICVEPLKKPRHKAWILAGLPQLTLVEYRLSRKQVYFKALDNRRLAFEGTKMKIYGVVIYRISNFKET